MEAGLEREAWQDMGFWMATPLPGTLLVIKAVLLLKFLPRGTCDQHLLLLLRSQQSHQSSLGDTNEFIGFTHRV